MNKQAKTVNSTDPFVTEVVICLVDIEKAMQRSRQLRSTTLHQSFTLIHRSIVRFVSSVNASLIQRFSMMSD